MNDDKSVDESWKDNVENEKDKKEGDLSPEAGNSGEKIPEVNFIGYITSLAFQSMVFLGEIPNPITNEPEKNLVQAKLLIDTLALLREKLEPMLQRELEHRGLAQGSRGFETKLIGWMEVLP